MIDALDRLADAAGIAPFFVGYWGERQETSPATKRALLEAMGIACAAVSHLSADLGDPRSIYRDGRISLVNRQARDAGVALAMTAVEAADRLLMFRNNAG